MSDQVHIWLRAETKPGEARRALVPSDAARLLAAGFAVTVERSAANALPDQEYRAAGCTLAEPESWRDAPRDAFVLGVKELPEDGSPLAQRHIYFAHAYKNQRGWQDLLGRFRLGGGELLDLEYLVDENGRRVAAFGYWAGFCGAALAVMTWCGQQMGFEPALNPVSSWPDKESLVEDVQRLLEKTLPGSESGPTLIIIGAAGRVGSGARALADALQIDVTLWDIEETAAGGPFREVLDHEIFVNCVFVDRPLPPFITPQMTAAGRRLTVVADVSCDPHGDHNPVPLYDDCTTIDSPTKRLRQDPKPLDLIAIDHLPSLLPRESSEDFSRQLLPCLLKLGDAADPVWQRARTLFKETCAKLEG